jgi:hypothetical protein
MIVSKIKKFFVTIFMAYVLALLGGMSGMSEEKCLELGVNYFKNTIKA